MPLKRYFKEGQKILLSALNASDDARQVDALTCYLKMQGNGYVDLDIPYDTGRDESYPFDPQQTFAILSDSMGVGVRLTGHYEKHLGDNTIRLRHNSDLQLIHRRVEERRQANLEVGYTKGKGKLKSFRQQWQKNIKILEGMSDLAKLPKFPKVNVNISMTGVGFKVKTPIEIADLALLYINLDDGKPPVCTMTEIVWRSEEEQDGRCMAGFQFLNILETDQKRIRQFVRNSGKKVNQDT